MYVLYKPYYDYIKPKYNDSQNLYKKKVTDPNDFLYAYETMNVYPTFPVPIVLPLKQKDEKFTHNTSFDMTKINSNDKIIKNKLEEYATYLDKIVDAQNTEKVRRYFDYELRDEIKNKYNLLYVTNAYLKMYEILSMDESLVGTNKEILTMHICEHPGKFIYAVKDFLKKKNQSHQFVFQSLNTAVRKDGFKLDPALKNDPRGTLDYGKDGTGDITNIDNIKYYIEKYKHNNFSLFTSDCGEDYSDDFTKQEEGLHKIYFSALKITLGISKIGANYVFKMFTFSNLNTIKLLYIASLCYDTVDLVRVMSTKGNSSEIYCICRGFNGHHVDENIDQYDKVFIDRIVLYHELLMMRRIVTINQLIFRVINDEYAKNNPTLTKKIKLYVDYYVNYFIQYIGLPKKN
jgi:23S rRNA U2552 (ribose-2'-O)-methylase RlmE/FtsJ